MPKSAIQPERPRYLLGQTGTRNQARRLPPDRSARRQARAAVQKRYPLITEAALRNRNSSFVIDGEAVLLGVDGRSDFNGLHSRKHDAEVEVEFYSLK
jgi:hypothetical protein